MKNITFDSIINVSFLLQKKWVIKYAKNMQKYVFLFNIFSEKIVI